MSNIGSRCKVMHGNANKTSGGLTKEDLMYNKQGKIVSIKMSKNAKKEKRLEKAGWTVQEGVFGAIPMKGGVEDEPLISSPGSPNRGETKPIKRAPFTKASPEYNAEQLRNKAISIAIKMEHDLTKAKMINNREGANPNNAIFINKDPKILEVYKIGLWQDDELCIRNEVKTYLYLMTCRPNDINIHYPEMLNIEIIPGTRYAILTLRFIENLTPISFKNNSSSNNKILKDEALHYLNDLHIQHNDEEKNLFSHIINGKKTFLCMDFEASFIDNTFNNEILQELNNFYKHNNRINYNNNHNNHHHYNNYENNHNNNHNNHHDNNYENNHKHKRIKSIPFPSWNNKNNN